MLDYLKTGLTEYNVHEEWNGKLEGFILNGLKESGIDIVDPNDGEEGYCQFLNCNHFKNTVANAIELCLDITRFERDGNFLFVFIDFNGTERRYQVNN